MIEQGLGDLWSLIDESFQFLGIKPLIVLEGLGQFLDHAHELG